MKSLRAAFWIVGCLLVASLNTPAFARENKPDPRLTPGEIQTSDLSLVCKRGYSKSVRKTTRHMKQETYRLYGIEDHANFKIDHLVPLSLGGADSMANIWPSDFAAGKYNADSKDRLELKMRFMVCHQNMNVLDAQHMFMKDWTEGYDRYCPTRAACPSFDEIQAKRYSRE